MLNLTIAALLISSNSHSPLFSTTKNYNIINSKYVRHFSSIFNLVNSNLRVKDTLFRQCLASGIIVDHVDYTGCADDTNNGWVFTDQNVELVRTTADHCAEFDSSFISITDATSIVINESLFSRTQVKTDFFSIVNNAAGRKAIFYADCFSQITTSYSASGNRIISSTSQESFSTRFQNDIHVEATSFYNNEVKDTNLISQYAILSAKSDNLTVLYSNFSKDTVLKGSLIVQLSSIYTPTSSVRISYCDMFENNIASFTSLVHEGNFKSIVVNFDVEFMTLLNSTLYKSVGSVNNGYQTPGIAVFWVTATNINIQNSAFVNLTSEGESKNIDLFAKFQKVNEVSNPQYHLTNCVFTRDRFHKSFEASNLILNYVSGTFDNVDTTTQKYVTVPFSMNEYLHQQYSQQCVIYRTEIPPTAPFTASSDFTRSSVFTSSSQFTASSAFTASRAFTASSAFTSSFTFLPSPPPSATPSVNAIYGVVGACGTALVSFGLAAIIWLIIRNFCIYDHANFLHIDV